ncbi:MAG: histidinol-phosphate transaminase [Actinomycetaceae bacterium]|nr:histidinol-phosphate transaminase [Actinomycetaceae bacterium]
MTDSFFRPEIDTLPAYVPGKKATDPSVIKAASNEMPFPTLPGVQAALATQLAQINRYPDMSGADMIAQIAAYHEISVDEVAISNGSTDLVELFLSAVCTPDSEVVYPWRSFEAYPIAVQVAGARSVQVPLRADGNNDLRNMLKAITPATRAIMICTPNNPTGSALTHTELRAFLHEVPQRIPVLLDEAYVDFVDMDDAVDGIALAREFANVISLRTFSKAYGLAGIRAGYAVGNPTIIKGLRAIATPFGVNMLAQTAARSALQERPEVDRRVGIIKDERTKLTTALRALGWTGPDSQSNFIWVPTGDVTNELAALCEAEGLTVRAFSGEGTRMTVAEPEANLRFVRAFGKFRTAQHEKE